METTQAMCESPNSGVDNAMAKLENETSEIELQVRNLIENLNSVLVPQGEKPCLAPANPNMPQPPPSMVTNHIIGIAIRLADLSQEVRNTRERLDV